MTKPKSQSKAKKAPDHFYTVTQAAKALKVHPESLRRSIRTGAIPLQPYEQPSYRSKRKYFFKVIDVELLAAQRENAPSKK